MSRWRKSFNVARLLSRVLARAALSPRRRLSVAERVADFSSRRLPVRERLNVRWSEQQIPFIEARSDDDLAVGIGAVQAHLRLAQMEIMRRLAYGRLSEVAGMVTFDLDHTLRILDFPRAVPGTLAAMPSDTRRWLERFVDGVNATIDQTAEQPEELSLAGVRAEPWSVEDVLAVGRLAAMDFSWRAWHKLRPLRDRPDWPHLWERLLRTQSMPAPNLSGAGGAAELVDWIWAGFGRGGSNAAAVSAARSASGSALLTSDPHLSIMLPSNWLAVGLASPGFNVVGLMIPALPVVTLGRNRRIAWSGTSLHAASSDLFDLTEAPEPVREREETIKVRWARAKKVVVREAEHGPIITDSPLLASPFRHDLALTWIGHRPSDEIGAMLGMMRAGSWDEFIEATSSFAVPAQNFVFADCEGRVGQSMGAHLPRRPHTIPNDLVMRPEALDHWREIVTAWDLPKRYDPAEGYVVSANDPPFAPAPVPIGFFFSPEERSSRLRMVLKEKETVSLDDLKELHRDVTMPTAPAMRDLLLQAGEWEVDAIGPPIRPLVAALRGWDGAHDAESAGALAFELLLYHFIHRIHGEAGLALFRASLHPWELLKEDVAALPQERTRAAAREAAGEAAKTFSRYRSWGDIHHIRLAHPLSALPVLGRRYVMADFPAGGSNETLMKTAHGLSSGPHRVAFGANARFLADLGDPDANYVVLLGGQDGWIRSTTFADQVALWRRGEYCHLPLDPETAPASFPHETVFRPEEITR